MNMVFKVGLAITLLIVCLAAYWYYNPQHLPGMFRTSPQGLQVPTPKSPVNNFRPPSF